MNFVQVMFCFDTVVAAQSVQKEERQPATPEPAQADDGFSALALAHYVIAFVPPMVASSLPPEYTAPSG